MPTPAPPSAVVRAEVVGWAEPAVAFRALASQHPDLVWRDRRAAASDRVDFIGLPVDGDVLTVPPGVGEAAVQHLTADLRRRLPAPPLPSDLLGWWGLLGYELGTAALGLPVPEDASAIPAAAFLLASVGACFDHDEGTVAVIGLPGQEAAVQRLVALLQGLAGRPAPSPVPAAEPEWAWRHDRERYLRMVEDCRGSIAAGDAYQLCLTNRITARLPQAPDPLDVHLRLREQASVANGLLLRIGGWTLVCASPEAFLTVDAAGRAVSRPIKGTRPRGADAADDARLIEQLRTSEKERAENLMIVDLVRNDLARVSAVGSVEVTGLFEVETYPALHQLVSTVASRLVGDPLDALVSLFPAGSMTGAPKRSAMRILQALEAGPRGAYAGAVGRIPVDGTVDLSVVIRSIVLHGAEATIGTGGGITIQSEPEAEWDEIVLKARPLLRALGARL